MMSIFGLIMFWIRRSYYPIKQRRPWLVILEVGFMYLSLTINIVSDVIPDFVNVCLPFKVLAPLFFHIALEIAVLRVFLLFYWDFLTQVGMRYYYGNDKDKARPLVKFDRVRNFLLWKRNVFSEKFFFCCSVIIALFFYGTTLLLSLPKYVSSGASDQLVCIEHRENNLLVTMIHVIFVLVFEIIFVFVVLKDIQENLNLKKEFYAHSCVTSFYICMIILYYSVIKWNFSTATAAKLQFFLIVFLPYLNILAISVFRVLYWSYTKSNQQILIRTIGLKNQKDIDELFSTRKHLIHAVMQDFREIFNDPKGFDILLQFSKKDFCSESVLFLKECNDYKELFRLQESQITTIYYAVKIYNDFVGKDSTYGINLSSEIRQHLDEIFLSEINEEKKQDFAVENLKDVFQSAEEEISKLLIYDCLPRLKLTDQYLKWKEELEIFSTESVIELARPSSMNQ